jgi:hypothetical protein
MRKNTFLILILFLISCNNSIRTNSLKSDSIQVVEGKDYNKTIFSTPESLIAQFYYGKINHQLKIIAKCFGRKDTTGLILTKIDGLRYIIINKELITKNENEYRKNGDCIMKVKELYNNKDSLIINYNVRKINDCWLIVGYSSEVEDKMEEDIQNLPDNLKR